jgi:hypothetical protein
LAIVHAPLGSSHLMASSLLEWHLHNGHLKKVHLFIFHQGGLGPSFLDEN